MDCTRHERRGASEGFESAVDGACKTVLLLLAHRRPDDLVLQAVNTLYGMVKRALAANAGRFAFCEPRLMLRSVYCGVSALRLRQGVVVQEVLKQVAEFDRTYVEGAGAQPASSLLSEVLQWRRDIDDLNRLRIRQDAHDMAGGLVSAKDIDDFISEAWRVASMYGAGGRRRLIPVEPRSELNVRLIAILANKVNADGRPQR
jgi:hypothetical protein